MTLFAAGDHAGTAGISTPTPRTWIDCHGAMERTQAQTQTRQPRTCRGFSTHFWMRPTEPDVWPDESFKRAQRPPLSPPNQPLFCLLVRAAESARSETPPPPRQPLPFRELPPRRKVVWIWICVCTQPIFANRQYGNANIYNTLTIPPVLLWARRYESQCRSLSALRHPSLSQLQHPALPHTRLQRSSCTRRRGRFPRLILASGVSKVCRFFGFGGAKMKSGTEDADNVFPILQDKKEIASLARPTKAGVERM